LRVDHIVYVDYERDGKKVMDRLDLEALSGDYLFQQCLSAAIDGTLAQEGLSQEDRLTLTVIQRSLEPGKKLTTDQIDKLPAKVKALLFAAYWSRMDITMYFQHVNMPYELINTNPIYKDNFLRGAFLNYIDGHSDTDNPESVTHDLPRDLGEKDVADLASKRAAYERAHARGTAVPAEREEARPTAPAIAPDKQ